MLRLTFNVLLSLIIETKIQRKGKIGNGRLLVEFLQTFVDYDDTEKTHERSVLKIFNNEQVKSCAYEKLNKKINKFLPNGNDYRYDKIHFEVFEKSFDNNENYCNYLRKMSDTCNKILDKSKEESLMYTLLEILRQDDNISTLLYGARFISKKDFFGDHMQTKQICIEALLLGLLYQTHKYPDKTEKIGLMNPPENLPFSLVHFKDEQSLDLVIPISLSDNIRHNAKHQKTAEMKYHLELRYNNEIITEIPEKGNVFLYGAGGIGKSTLLLNQFIKNDDTIKFYFPLYQYRREIHEKLQPESCWILLQILLKYHYQYEYKTYEACAAYEGENTILQQLTELDKMLKTIKVERAAEYILLLDGLNEISSELQVDFIKEVAMVCREWKNVRIIIL